MALPGVLASCNDECVGDECVVGTLGQGTEGYADFRTPTLCLLQDRRIPRGLPLVLGGLVHLFIFGISGS